MPTSFLWIVIPVATVALYSALLCSRSWWSRTTHRRAAAQPHASSRTTRFLLVIPVLREQAVIREAIAHFARLRHDDREVRVVFVTSEREKAEPHPMHELSTAEVIDRELSAWRADGGRDIFRRIHYPYATGHMAEQINYAVRYVFEAYDTQIDIDNTFIGIFNVDSRPGIEVLEEVVGRHRETGACVLQQLSRYAPVRRHAPRTIGYAFACGFAVWQTRWSYLVERCRYLTSSRLHRARASQGGGVDGGLSRALWRMPFSYTVGHGLFVRFKEFVSMNYLPTRRPNEDAEFGFSMPFFGLTPLPLDTPDLAETTSSVFSLMSQQASWIVGPMLSFQYLKATLRLVELPWWRRLGALVYAFRCLLDAVFWILGPLVLVISAVWCAAVAWQADALTREVAWFVTASWLAFFAAPTIALCLSPLKPFGDMSARQVIVGSLCLPFCYLLHGAGGLLGFARVSYAVVTQSRYKKHKTER